MHYSSLLTAALAVGGSFASPVQKRQAVDDFLILNYALTLEYLERKFYQDGLANYTQADFVAAGFPDPFYTNLKEIANDEKTHVDFISKAITAAGGTPVHEATYAFPATDVKTFVTVSSILEGVGVSAYLGAAASIMKKDYLTAAGSILTVEARHSSYIRTSLGESGFPAPFDTPLDFKQVFSLASNFITAFSPSDPPLPFTAFPALEVACVPAFDIAGTTSLTFTGACSMYSGKANGAPIYAAFYSGVKPTVVPVQSSGADYTVTIPSGVAGQVYVVLTTSADSPSDDNILAGPAVMEVYAPGAVPSGPPPTC